jgi:predicted esterase
VFYAGFSQGGFMALHCGLNAVPQEEPAAIISLSGFLLGVSRLAEPNAALRSTPIFLGHGKRDQVVLPLWQFEVKDTLEQKGFNKVTTRRYEADHSLHPDEVRDVQAFLRELI